MLRGIDGHLLGCDNCEEKKTFLFNRNTSIIGCKITDEPNRENPYGQPDWCPLKIEEEKLSKRRERMLEL